MTMIETSRAAPAPFRARAEALRDGREPPALPGGNSFQRILTAKAVAALTHRQTADVAARLWPSDKVMAQLMTRAVPATAMTSVAGWAAELAHKIVIDALEGHGPGVGRRALVVACARAHVRRQRAHQRARLRRGRGKCRLRRRGAADPRAPARWDGSVAAAVQARLDWRPDPRDDRVLERGGSRRRRFDALSGAALDGALFASTAATTAAAPGLRNGVGALTASAATDPLEAF
jgi:hypothetical protein